jgi:hypothetical protein
MLAVEAHRQSASNGIAIASSRSRLLPLLRVVFFYFESQSKLFLQSVPVDVRQRSLDAENVEVCDGWRRDIIRSSDRPTVLRNCIRFFSRYKSSDGVSCSAWLRPVDVADRRRCLTDVTVSGRGDWDRDDGGQSVVNGLCDGGGNAIIVHRRRR